jgi:hypothetical protein
LLRAALDHSFVLVLKGTRLDRKLWILELLSVHFFSMDTVRIVNSQAAMLSKITAANDWSIGMAGHHRAFSRGATNFTSFSCYRAPAWYATHIGMPMPITDSLRDASTIVMPRFVMNRTSEEGLSVVVTLVA